ncbi:hypothetical protein [Rhizobium sp. AG855]|uniref:helix-turn-helix transcriptional regulator n=1 Tax=Rhizobium sp. AG855 TaxID=2183898 RepID=UPI0015FF368C|nr:hypothetical protein [Rhizobium sp. AG855]
MSRPIVDLKACPLSIPRFAPSMAAARRKRCVKIDFGVSNIKNRMCICQNSDAQVTALAHHRAWLTEEETTLGLERTDHALQVNIRARMGKPQDAAAIASLLASTDPIFGALAASNAATFARLIDAEAIRTGCIELQQPDGGWLLGATGLSAFIDEATTRSWLAEPRANFPALLLQRALTGSTAFLTPSEIGRANSGDGLNLFILGFSYSLSPQSPLLPPLLTRAIGHFVSCHQGYKLLRLMREDPAPIAEMFLRSGMRALAHFDPEPGQDVGRVAMVMERSETMPLFPNSPATMLFQFVPPQIGFSPSERRILHLALEGLSDGDLASELSISPHTLKRSWRVIFDRALSAAPLIFGSLAEPRDSQGVRGQEKRRHLLQYLRDNPQELRPYDLPRKTRSR